MEIILSSTCIIFSSQNLSIYAVVATISGFNDGALIPYSPQRGSQESIVHDIFFESQEFKHSLLFEFIWAIFPTILLVVF